MLKASFTKVKEGMKKFREAIKENVRAGSACMFTAMAMSTATPITAHAVNSSAITFGSSTNTDDLIQGVAGLVLAAAWYVGMFLVVWGAFQLILAFKNEDADSKSRAIMCIVTGGLLVGLRTFMTSIFSGGGTT